MNEMSENGNGNITNKVQLAVIATDISYMKSEITDLKRLVSDGYATKSSLDNAISRIKLLERAVYGLLGLIVIAVVGAIMRVVLK